MQRSSWHNIAHLVGTYLTYAIFAQAQNTILSPSAAGELLGLMSLLCDQ
jgi:hypothetical protein